MDSEIKELAIATIIFFLFTIGLPVFSLFIFGGATEQDLWNKSIFYFGVGTACFLVIVSISLVQYLLKGKWSWLNIIIHDPDISLFPQSLKKYLTPKNVIIFSIIFFSLLGMFASRYNTFFVAIPQTEFQVTETGSMLLASEPAASSETYLFLIPLSLMVSYIVYLLKNRKIDKIVYYFIMLIIIPLIIGFSWMMLHSLRYSGSELNLLGVFFFGFVGSLLTVVTGSVIPWWIWHFFNNFYQKANQIYSDEKIMMFTFIFIFVIILISLFLYFRKLIKGGRD